MAGESFHWPIRKTSCLRPSQKERMWGRRLFGSAAGRSPISRLMLRPEKPRSIPVGVQVTRPAEPDARFFLQPKNLIERVQVEGPQAEDNYKEYNG